MPFNIHPDASANFNQKAEEALRLFDVSETSIKSSSFPSQRFTHDFFEIKDVEELAELDFRGEEVGRYFECNGHRIGLKGEDYKAFEKLCNLIYNIPAIKEIISLKVVKNEVFNWMKYRHNKETSQSLIEYILPKFESVIEEMEIWVPIFGTEIESAFSVGRVLFQPITTVLMDKWYSAIINGRTKEEINELSDYFRQERKQVQGLAAGTISFKADPIRAGDLAISEVERMLNINRFFESSNFHPELSSHCTIIGKENLQKIKYYTVKSGKLISSPEFLLNKTSPAWRIDNHLLATIKESGLDRINGMLNSNKMTPYQTILIDTLQIYSRSGLAKLYSDKLVYLLVALETLLLRNGSESIQQNVGERLAFALAKAPAERKKIAKNFKDVYNLRSKFIHHGNDIEIEQLDILLEFMMNTWNFLRLAIINADIFRTKEDMIDALENIKYS